MGLSLLLCVMGKHNWMIPNFLANSRCLRINSEKMLNQALSGSQRPWTLWAHFSSPAWSAWVAPGSKLV